MYYLAVLLIDSVYRTGKNYYFQVLKEKKIPDHCILIFKTNKKTDKTFF